MVSTRGLPVLSFSYLFIGNYTINSLIPTFTNCFTIRPCVMVKHYNAPSMGRFAPCGSPVSKGHYTIKWCSGALFK
ncbi:hypothetical protein Hanom_Chr06g00494771 [Helianthus anomalus]